MIPASSTFTHDPHWPDLLAVQALPCFTPGKSRSARAGGAHEAAGGQASGVCRIVQRRSGRVADCGAPSAAGANATDRVLMHLPENDPEGQARLTVFRDTLLALGWIEARNITMEYRWTGGDPQRARVAAAEMADLAPEVILCHSGPMLSAMRDATRDPHCLRAGR